MITLENVKWYLALVCLFPSSPIKAEGIYKDGDVIIGALLPVRYTESDGLCSKLMAYHGPSYVEAVLYAIETINKDKSILPNVTLGYDIKDICTSPELANSMAIEFLNRNRATELKYQANDTCDSFQKYFGVLRKSIAAVVGTGDSSSSVVVASTFNIDDIPLVSPLATSEELSQPYFKTFFRPVPPDGQQAKALADIVDYFKWKYVYVVAVDTSYGRYGAMAFEREALERGTFCISQISFFPSSDYQQKVKAIVLKIKLASNVKVVVLWSGTSSANHFIEEAHKQGITGRTWLAPEGWSEATDLFKNKYMQIIGGFIGTKLRNYSITGYFHHLTSLNFSSVKVQNHTWWRDYWMLQQKCKNTSRCDFQSFRITKQRYKDMYSSYLPYVIDSVYVIAHALDALYNCSGNHCPKTEPFVNTKDVLRYIRNVAFEGITGKVEFDKNGNTITSAAYDIVNLHPGSTAPHFKVIGTWDRGKPTRLKINNLLYWNNGSKKVPVSICEEPCRPGYMQTVTVACCWKCIRCPIGFISQIYSSQHCTECPIDKMPDQDQTECIDLPEVNVSFYDAQSIVLLVVAGIELILVIFVLLIGLKYRNTPIVKASNREMSVLFLFGIVVGIVSGVILLARPTPVVCYFNYPLHALYYTLCLSILIVKTNRLVQAFQLNFASSRISHLCNGKNAQFVILLLLNVITIVLLTLWHVLDPPHFHITIERLKSKHLECRGHEGTLGFALQSTLYAYQLCLAIFCAYFAFKARNLPENFSEARYIAFAMYMQLLCSICYAILQTTVEGIFLAVFSSAIILVSSFGFLVCMFAPKVYIILKFPEKNTNEYVKASVASHSFQRSMKIVPLGVAMVTDVRSDGNAILKEAVGNRQSNVFGGATMEVTEHNGNSDCHAGANVSDVSKSIYNHGWVSKEQKKEESCFDNFSDAVVQKQRGSHAPKNENSFETTIPDSHEMISLRHKNIGRGQTQPIPNERPNERPAILELSIQPNS